MRSADEGRTWTEPRVMFDGADDDRDPHVTQLRDGTLVCSFFPYRKGGDGKPEYEACVIESRDGGWTWDPMPRVLARSWACSAPVRELPDGTRLLGVYHEEGQTAYGGVLRSTDAGRTWSDPIPIGRGSGVRLDAETDLVQLRDGSLYAALRGDRTNMHFAISLDTGLTWSGVTNIGFQGHCPHFTRLASGEILLTHRLPHTALHISGDEGKSWRGPFQIDDTTGAYPSTVELRDGSVLVVYYEEGEGSGIRARRFSLTNSGLRREPLHPEPRAIGSRLELFADDFLIERLEGCSRVLHRPQPDGIALRFDAPWEGAFSGYVTVLSDGGLYRMYYRGLPVAGADGSTNEVTCYAESADGVRWTKPLLGLFEVAGSRSNNVMLAGQPPFSHNFAPFLDTRPGVAASERFKALAGTAASGLHAFASADGLRWQPLRPTAVLTQGAFDSQNVAFWSDAEGCYALYLRTWTGGDFAGYRTISRSTSTNFVDWTAPEEMTFDDGPREHLYTSQTHPYYRAPHLYVALPMRFLPGRAVLSAEQAQALGVGNGYAGDTAETVLMTSRGGNRYHRPFMEGFIRPGPDLGNWASRAGLTALGILPTGPAEMSVYKQAHYAQPNCHLVRHVLRTDGFVSVNAPLRGGEFTTRLLTFTGRELVLNFSAGAAGGIRVEIQGEEGRAVPGRSLADAVEQAGDELERTVAWKNGTDVSALAGSPIRLRFVMQDADLYSMRFR